MRRNQTKRLLIRNLSIAQCAAGSALALALAASVLFDRVPAPAVSFGILWFALQCFKTAGDRIIRAF